MRNKTGNAFLIILILVIVFGGVYYKASHTFNTDKWINRNGDSRLKIYDSLMQKYELVGMSTDEVISLLGKSDDEYFKEDNSFVYYIGVPFLNTDAYHLVITFEDDIVTSVELKSD
ncbi:MAG: hypothetical protein ACOX6L_00470 [Syntrophomonadaceae bacterium]